MIFGGVGSRELSDRRSHGRQSRFKSKDTSKIKSYWWNELGHCVRNCLQFKDRMKATVIIVDGSNSDGYCKALMVSDEVSIS